MLAGDMEEKRPNIVWKSYGNKIISSIWLTIFCNLFQLGLIITVNDIVFKLQWGVTNRIKRKVLFRD